MGLNYYRVTPSILESLQALIEEHESELVGPRARGYWFDRPEVYDYIGVRETAHQLDQVGQAKAIEHLELSEVQAHSLSLLDVHLPADDLELAPALFMSSASAETIRRWFKIAVRKLGSDPQAITQQLRQGESDPRFSPYLEKQIRHLREALPLVWDFHQRAVDAGDSILVVDLRARDLEIPEEVELAGIY